MKSMLFFALSLALAVPAGAQVTYAEDTSPTATDVQVHISCDTPVEFARIVLNGDEDGKFELDRRGPYWRGEAVESFDVKSRTANIRFKGGRTACVKVSDAVRLPEDPNRWAALFALQCLDDDVWTLRIDTSPDLVPIPYVRFLSAVGVRAIPCEDRSAGRTGRATLTEVASRYETIYLRFGAPVRAYLFSDLTIERGKAAGKTITASGTTLTRGDISAAWSQGSRNSPAEMDMMRKVVLDQRLQTVTLRKVE
jgi:hypothetical protein